MHPVDPQTDYNDAEGWMRDPHGRFGARWYSAGQPASLVRSSDGVEGRHEVTGPPPAASEALDVPQESGADLLRADAAATEASSTEMLRSDPESRREAGRTDDVPTVYGN